MRKLILSVLIISMCMFMLSCFYDNIILGDDYQSGCLEPEQTQNPLSNLSKSGELGSLSYEVNEGVLTVFHNDVYLNCGAEIHFAIEVDGLNIRLKEVDTGMSADCMCYFDLSVVLENLVSGNTYHIEVWDEDNTVKYGEIDVLF